MTTSTTPLTGDTLLQTVKELKETDAAQSTIVVACGYINDKGQPAFTHFYENLMAAKGITMASNETPPVTDSDGKGYKTVAVSIPVTCYYQVPMTVPNHYCAEDIYNALDKDALMNGEGEMTWDDIKDAWRDDTDYWTVFDINGDEVK